MPFEQLARSVFTLGPREWGASSLTRYEGRVATVGRLRGLRERGWRLGPVGDGGVVSWLTRALGGGAVAALHIAGMRVQGDEPQARVALGPIDFGDELLDERDFDPALASRRPLDTRSPVALSELLRDVDALLAPA